MQQLLGEKNTSVINIQKNKNIDLSKFDRVIIGGSIHAGMIQKKIKDFCNNHLEELLQKSLGLFYCGMNEPEYDSQMEKAFPQALRNHAKSKQVIGGEFLFEKMNFFQKLIVKKISGIKESVSKIDDDKIKDFVMKFNE